MIQQMTPVLPSTDITWLQHGPQPTWVPFEVPCPPLCNLRGLSRVLCFPSLYFAFYLFFSPMSFSPPGYPLKYPAPTCNSPPPGGYRHFDVSLDKGLLCCSLCAGAHYQS